MASNGSSFLVLEKIRDVEDSLKEKLRVLEEKVRELESSTRLMKIIVVYNAITNTAIAVLLWQLVSLLAAHHSGGAAQVAAAGTQQIAIVKGG